MKATRMMMLVGLLMVPVAGFAQEQPVASTAVAVPASACAPATPEKECPLSGFAGADWVRFVQSGLHALSDQRGSVSLPTLPLTSLGVSF